MTMADDQAFLVPIVVRIETDEVCELRFSPQQVKDSEFIHRLDARNDKKVPVVEKILPILV